MERFNAGDAGAFDEIVTRYRPKLSAFAFTVLHDRADAEEIAQDALLRAHRYLGRFRGDCRLATWLHTIALNLARNRYWYHVRHCRPVTQSLDSPISENGPDTFSELTPGEAPSPVDAVLSQEFSDAVDQCIHKLAPMHRDILQRRILRDCPYDDIAAALGISVGTVKSRIARARERLRTLLVITCPELRPATTTSAL